MPSVALSATEDVSRSNERPTSFEIRARSELNERNQRRLRLLNSVFDEFDSDTLIQEPVQSSRAGQRD